MRHSGRAERLRWDIRQLVTIGLRFAEADTTAAKEFDHLVVRVQGLVDELRSLTVRLEGDELDLDYLGGFEEPYTELLLIVEQIRRRAGTGMRESNQERLVARLREIDDEVGDAAAALEQYFRSRNREYLAQAEWAGQRSTVAAGLAAVLGIALVLTMGFMLHRWVTRPIADLGRAADDIGAGNLDFEIPPRPEGEWRKVADALHGMTRSLSYLQQQLRTSERLSAIGEVAAYTAHNIRNPLASIRAMAQHAHLQPTVPPDLRESLEDIIQCVDKMEEWIARLLGFARPLSLEAEMCHITDLAAEAVQIVHRMATDKGVQLKTAITPAIPVIMGDPSLLEQAMYLIVSNAIEATPKGGSVTLSVALDGLNPPERVVIAVEDTGHGIPAHLLDSVLNPFVTSKEGGSGLGLAQAKKIVDLHLGSIDIESTEGEGTCVRIHLPLKTNWSTHGTDSDC